MHISSLVKSSKTIVSALQTLFTKAEIDDDFDPYERRPVNRDEISKLVALHYRKDDPRGYSDIERRDHDNLSALRDILYPTSAT